MSFSVGVRELVSIVGPSGCGKSTILNSIAGLVSPTTGDVRIFGCPVTSPRTDVGMVFQKPVLLKWRRVLENVLLPADILGIRRKEVLDRAYELLGIVGLTGYEKRFPRELSGGMQQRVAIARALIHKPALLLMDEPFAGLDSITREDMNAELARIVATIGTTTLVVTHSIEEAAFLSDRVVVLTPRPAHVAGVVQIAIPRPRILDVRLTEKFNSVKGQIDHLIRGMSAH